MEEAVSANSAQVQDYLGGMGAMMGNAEAALESFAGTLQREALVMTYNDVFFGMGLITLATVPLVLFLRPLPKNASLSMH